MQQKAPVVLEGAARVRAERPALEFGSAWEYSPAPESTAHVKLQKRYDLFIGGRFVAPKSGRYFETVNPATEEKLAEVAEAGEADVEAAVRAAEGGTAPVVEAQADRARQVPLPHRPPAAGEGAGARRSSRRWTAASRSRNRATSTFRSPRRTSSTTPAGRTSWSTPSRAAARSRAVGVCGQIIPWNFPLLMAAWKIAPALACGNTVVLKPAETTPLTALHLAEIFAGGRSSRRASSTSSPAPARPGAALVNHPDVDKIAFTGSTEVGKHIAARDRRHRQAAHPRARRQGGRTSSSTTRRSTRRSRASSTASTSTRATSAAPGSRLLVQESIADT